jgi:hypothetical protein
MLNAIDRRAAEEKLAPSDWCRRVLAAALDYDPDLLILLREVVATRRETRALLKELIQRGELSTERFHFLMNDTEEKKGQLAERVLEQARKSLNRLPPAGDKQ